MQEHIERLEARINFLEVALTEMQEHVADNYRHIHRCIWFIQYLQDKELSEATEGKDKKRAPAPDSMDFHAILDELIK